MRGAAQQNENGKQPEHRLEYQITPALGEDSESQWDGEISDADPKVGDGIGPEKTRFPQKAEPVWGEPRQIEQPSHQNFLRFEYSPCYRPLIRNP